MHKRAKLFETLLLNKAERIPVQNFFLENHSFACDFVGSPTTAFLYDSRRKFQFTKWNKNLFGIESSFLREGLRKRGS